MRHNIMANSDGRELCLFALRVRVQAATLSYCCIHEDCLMIASKLYSPSEDLFLRCSIHTGWPQINAVLLLYIVCELTGRYSFSWSNFASFVCCYCAVFPLPVAAQRRNSQASRHHCGIGESTVQSTVVRVVFFVVLNDTPSFRSSITSPSNEGLPFSNQHY